MALPCSPCYEWPPRTIYPVTVTVDHPLIVLTDSANVMSALQHCSRLEICADFPSRQVQQLAQDLQAAGKTPTTPTKCVKITAQTSIELKERADYWVAIALSLDDALTQNVTLRTDPYLLLLYRTGVMETQKWSMPRSCARTSLHSGKPGKSTIQHALS
jgi:hypothetical protein